MMTPDQVKIVVRVYNHLIENEKRGWSGLDDYMDYLEYLDDEQLHREADIIYTHHKSVNVRCQQEHDKDKCLIPLLVESVGAILDLYKENNDLHIKNRYILQYYLSMNQSDMIVTESKV